MTREDDLIEIVTTAPVEAADRALAEWSYSLGVDRESLGDDLVAVTGLGVSGEPRYRSYALRRARADSVYASAGKPLPMTTSEFVERLTTTARSAQDLLERHIDDYEEVLLHPFVARVRDLAFEAFKRGDADLSRRLVSVVDVGLREGDAAVENAVAASFVEGTWWAPDGVAFIASWPPSLREEAERQRKWRPDA